MKNLYDLIIIGAGSAGLTAGIYAGRSKLKTLILDKEQIGGQIKITAEVVNYPGILHTSGQELIQTMRKQAESFGVEIRNETVESVDFRSEFKKVKTSQGEYEAIGVIVATGAKPRTLGFKGEETFRGRGIGRHLLVHLAAIAKERGCGRMEWSVLDWNEPAIRFYRSLGARPMDEWTVYRLTEPETAALAAEASDEA